MKLGKSVFIYKALPNNRAKFSIREEIIYKKYVVNAVYPLFVSFSLVDGFIVGMRILDSIILRTIGCCLSYFLYYGLRGRAKYLTRNILATAPFYFVILYVAIYHGFVFSLYMIGHILVGFTHMVIFPMRLKFGFIANLVYLIPIFVFIFKSSHTGADLQNIVMLLTMLMGFVCLASVSGAMTYDNLVRLYDEQRVRAFSLKNRISEIKRLGLEFAKRKVFENQCSPQVASVALVDPQILEPNEREVVTLVFDIARSTNRAFKIINTRDYLHVINRCTRIFSEACMRGNVVVDKYIGDGAQALAGAPFSQGIASDITSAIRAVQITEFELEKERKVLEEIWGTRLDLKYAITAGKAIVGFQGEAVLKTYTALGPWVSFCHRICGRAGPGEIALYDATNSISQALHSKARLLEVDDIKGLTDEYDEHGNLIESGMTFVLRILEVEKLEEGKEDAIGICQTCGRSLYLGENIQGMPMAYSVECSEASSTCKYNLEGFTRNPKSVEVF